MWKGLRLGANMLLRRPVLCLWQVTGRCNFSCRICDFWRDTGSEDLDLDGCARVARGLRTLGPLMLSLAGGEPLLRPDLPDIVRVVSRDHYCAVITNGWEMTRERARELWTAGLRDAVVSIDYASPDRHDAQRGRAGAFSRAVRAVELLRETRPQRSHKVRINTVVMNDNRDQLEGLLLLAEELGVAVSFTLYSDRLGRKVDRRPDTPIADYLLELRRRHPRHVTSPAAYLAQFDGAIAKGIAACNGGRTFLNINSRGQLSRCIDRNDQPLLDLTQASPRQIRATVRVAHESCCACWTACRALGDASTGPAGLGAWPDNIRARRG
jgi:MoaA/NifB/PqqE/SkfB family radical SAM enzyme